MERQLIWAALFFRCIVKSYLNKLTDSSPLLLFGMMDILPSLSSTAIVFGSYVQPPISIGRFLIGGASG